MALFCIRKEKIDKLKEQRDNLNKKRPEDLWTDDLTAFEEEYVKHYPDDE